jgi:hypothetical protein
LSYEDPHALLGRLRLGREEFCQRLLTSLILGSPYPRWNSRSAPSVRGVEFLRRLDALSFGEARWMEGGVVVDEFDLPRRSEDDRGGAPDQAVLWPDRLWFIELKTEAASHRRDQLPSYYDLAAHHYPGVPVDITYLTPPMTTPGPAVQPPNRYAHVTWTQVAHLVASEWAAPAAIDEGTVRDALLDTIASLEMTPQAWREQMAPGPAHQSMPDPAPAIAVQQIALASQPSRDLLTAALRTARQTAADGGQRALDIEIGSLEALQTLRLEIRRLLAREPSGSILRQVSPWLWSASTSGGGAITSAGRTTGYELRLSRYKKPVR